MALAHDTAANAVVFCDFDGTITTRDTCDAVLTRFADPSWHEVDERFHRGEIGSSECIMHQFGTIRSSDGEVRHHLADTIEIDRDFVPFARAVETAAIPLIILSDGFELNIEAVLSAHRLGHLRRFANRIEFTPSGPVIAFPHSKDGCLVEAGHCKCAQIERWRGDRHVVLIGDGYSDRCAARLAHTIFAKGVLREHCEEQSIDHTPYRTFADILASDRFHRLIGQEVVPVQ